MFRKHSAACSTFSLVNIDDPRVGITTGSIKLSYNISRAVDNYGESLYSTEIMYPEKSENKRMEGNRFAMANVTRKVQLRKLAEAQSWRVIKRLKG